MTTRNKLHNVAIISFFGNEPPTTTTGPMTAARIIEECAHQMAWPVSSGRPSIIRVFSATGLEVVSVRTEDDAPQFVPVCHPTPDKTTKALYEQVGDKWDAFRKSYASAVRRYAKH